MNDLTIVEMPIGSIFKYKVMFEDNAVGYIEMSDWNNYTLYDSNFRHVRYLIHPDDATHSYDVYTMTWLYDPKW